MKRAGRVNTIITSRISRVSVAVATLVTAAFIALGGLSPVGAQATGTYECGTYGGGNYDQTDCVDTPATTGSGSTSTGSTGSSSNGGSSSSTGSSSSSSSTSTSTDSILLNDFSEYTASDGKELPLKQGQVLYFNLNGEKHTITVKSITASTLIVTIASTPTDVPVAYGQTVKYDVDGDGTPDISIAYNDFASSTSTANATFRALAVTASTGTTTPTTTGSTTDNSTGGTTQATGSTNLWWIWLIPIVLGLGLLAFAIVAIRRRKAAAAGGSNFGGPARF